jgi:hypothetical protein
MNTQLSEQDIAFREEVRQFLREAYTEDIERDLSNPETNKAAIVRWQKKLFDKGWIAPSWPKEHGGTGWTITQKYIYECERATAGIMDVTPFGLKMVGPVIYTYGTEAQKEKFLPQVLNSDHWWCQGYSEPGAGSDLASLKTRADKDGDHYVVNGAKIWTSYAQHADWIFCLVRTNSEGKKQSGITFLLIDMASEGITVNPIESIDRHHSLNEVEFSNVRVPVENVIGEPDQGWTYAKALLAHERTAIANVADSRRHLDEILDAARTEIHNGKPLIEDATFQRRVSDIDIDLMALEYTELRALASMSSGQAPGPESSLLKIKGTEIQQAVQQLKMETAGYYQGVLVPEGTDNNSGHAFGDRARKQFMYGRASTIYGGSNEVQKNIIAKAVLGL